MVFVEVFGKSSEDYSHVHGVVNANPGLIEGHIVGSPEKLSRFGWESSIITLTMSSIPLGGYLYNSPNS